MWQYSCTSLNICQYTVPEHTFCKQGVSVFQQKSACGRLFSHKQLLGVQIHMKMLLRTSNINYNALLVSNGALYSNYIVLAIAIMNCLTQISIPGMALCEFTPPTHSKLAGTAEGRQRKYQLAHSACLQQPSQAPC